MKKIILVLKKFFEPYLFESLSITTLVLSCGFIGLFFLSDFDNPCPFRDKPILLITSIFLFYACTFTMVLFRLARYMQINRNKDEWFFPLITPYICCVLLALASFTDTSGCKVHIKFETYPLTWPLVISIGSFLVVFMLATSYFVYSKRIWGKIEHGMQKLGKSISKNIKNIKKIFKDENVRLIVTSGFVISIGIVWYLELLILFLSHENPLKYLHSQTNMVIGGTAVLLLIILFIFNKKIRKYQIQDKNSFLSLFLAIFIFALGFGIILSVLVLLGECSAGLPLAYFGIASMWLLIYFIFKPKKSKS